MTIYYGQTREIKICSNITVRLNLNHSIYIFAFVKKLFILIIAVILLASCTDKVCPAYGDSANNVKSTLFQSGSYRADGINKVYRDSYSYRKK